MRLHLLSKLKLPTLCYLIILFVLPFALVHAETTDPDTKAVVNSQSEEPEVVAAEREPAAQAKNKKKPSATVAAKPLSEGQIVTKINIEGTRKIEKDAILARLKTKENMPFSMDQIREDVDAVFKMGYFYDVEVSRQVTGNQVVLTYKVEEKPSVVEIKYVGTSELKEEEVSEASGLKPYEILNMAKIHDAQEKILKLYEDKGYFLAKADYQIDEVKAGESVRLTFNITESDKVKVKKITFLGNRALKDGKLKDRMETQEGGFFSFMSGSGSYKQDAFDRDVQRLKFLYFNEGYVQVKVDRPQVYVTPDKKSIYITIRIEEGDQFSVGDIDFSGDILFSRDELFDTIAIDESGIFSYETLQKDLSNLQAKYGDLGYAFANIIPRTRINEKERKVDITFEFDKGQKVYFGEINVVGNSKTRDKVVRRELRIREGELYNETHKRKSLENIQRLGFFEEVNFKTSTPPDKQDILNIDIVVKERNTGTIQLGAGYGSATGFSLQGQVNQTNFLGKGEKLGASITHNDTSDTYNFNFTEPYFLDTEWSVGFDLYKNITDRTDYREDRLGGAFRFGHPLGENLNGYIRYKLDKTNLTDEGKDVNGKEITDQNVFPLKTASGLTSSVTTTLEYDTRNDRFAPSKGILTSGSLEYAGLGGDLKYTKGNSTFRFYKKLFWEVVFRNNISYSFISSHDDSEPPFNELFLLGGPYSLRGYRMFQVGKRVFSQNAYDIVKNNNPGMSEADLQKRAMRPFGGKQQLYYSTELEFPLINEAGLKGVVFYDIGQAEDTITNKNFYSDVGFGFRWFSPIGPLRFEWGFPLDGDPVYHDPVNFDFSIGSPF